MPTTTNCSRWTPRYPTLSVASTCGTLPEMPRAQAKGSLCLTCLGHSSAHRLRSRRIERRTTVLLMMMHRQCKCCVNRCGWMLLTHLRPLVIIPLVRQHQPISSLTILAAFGSLREHWQRPQHNGKSAAPRHHHLWGAIIIHHRHRHQHLRRTLAKNSHPHSASASRNNTATRPSRKMAQN